MDNLELTSNLPRNWLGVTLSPRVNITSLPSQKGYAEKGLTPRIAL